MGARRQLVPTALPRLRVKRLLLSDGSTRLFGPGEECVCLKTSQIEGPGTSECLAATFARL